MASQFEELITKQLQLLKEAMPSLSRVGLLYRFANLSTVLAAAEAAAVNLGLATRMLEVAGPTEFDNAFRAARGDHAGAILVVPSPYFDTYHGSADRAGRTVSFAGVL